MYKENSDKRKSWQYETGWRLLQRLFDFQQHIDDIPRVFTSSREQIFGASIFPHTITRSKVSQTYCVNQIQPAPPKHISQLLNCHIYTKLQNQPEVLQTPPLANTVNCDFFT